MQKSYKALRHWLSLVGVLTVAIGCGSYSATNVTTMDSSAAVTCTDPACHNPTADNLSLNVNLGGNTQYGLTADIAEFNLGGDCNEGGYGQNTVRWELWLNGTKLRDSGMLGMVPPGNVNVDSHCANGRFLLYVNLNQILEDNVKRVGLLIGSGTTRASYDLWVEVFATDPTVAQPIRNVLKARKRVSLSAL